MNSDMSDITVPAEEFGYASDNMQRLWTPHRMAYINGESKPATSQAKECPFCTGPQKKDEDALIVYRGEHVYVLLNLFPYNSGHLLVCPYEHVSMYTDISAEVRDEFGDVSAQAMRTLKKVYEPHGFNLGMNQGAVAGAGIAAHLHQHVIPRWRGDSNFFPIIAQTKAMPELLGEARQRLAENWCH